MHDHTIVDTAYRPGTGPLRSALTSMAVEEVGPTAIVDTLFVYYKRCTVASRTSTLPMSCGSTATVRGEPQARCWSEHDHPAPKKISENMHAHFGPWVG